MPKFDFTKADAEELIAIAQEAPIPGGARQAVARADLYQRFVKFYEHAAKPAPVQRPRKVAADVTAEDVTK